VLASTENELSDSEFELLGGELMISSKQEFGKLTFNGGAISLGSQINADSYVEVLTAKEIVGEVAVSDRFRAKTVVSDAGVSVLVRRERGTSIIVR
jgi:hypothetical protein